MSLPIRKKPKYQFDLFDQDKQGGNFVLCDNCKNYRRCRSIWRGSVNSVNCPVDYGFYEPKELEEIPIEIEPAFCDPVCLWEK